MSSATPFNSPETGLLTGNYTLRQTRSDTHWGAAGASAEFVIQTAAHLWNVGADSLTEMALGALLAKLGALGYRVRHRRLRVVNNEDIAELGLAAIEREFDVPASMLKVKSYGTNDADEYTTTASAETGERFSVSFVVRGDKTTVRSRSKEIGA